MEKKLKPMHIKPGMYALFFEALKEIAFKNGYNLVLHGSLNRDLDLIAIPWVDNPKSEAETIRQFYNYLIGKAPNEDIPFTSLPGGRRGYVINLNRNNKIGEWEKYEDKQFYLDISFTPLFVISNL